MNIDQLTLDGGHTGIRTLLRTQGRDEQGPAFTGIVNDLPLLEQVASFIRETLDGRSVDVLAAGVSDLGPDDTAQRLHRLLGGAARKVLLAHNSTTGHLGALGPRQGVVVKAGTGTVTLAVGATQVARVDGWGHLLGDLGSGYWIGREALSAVLAALDGRGKPTALTDLAAAEFPDLTRMYVTIQMDPDRVIRIASWSKAVSELADSDEVSKGISVQAGQLLANSAAIGLEQVDTKPRVSHGGSVFLNPVLEKAFRKQLTSQIPGVKVVTPKGDSLSGAALLPDVSPDSQIGKLISHS